MKLVPVNFKWMELSVIDADGVITTTMAMVPHARYDNVCGQQFEPDEDYTLVQLETRSRASHNFYFASVEEGFRNLPENISARWPTAEHLRKWCLVKTGWFDEKEFDWESKSDARRFAYFVRTEDAYALITVRGTKVIVQKAKSQAAAAMGKQAFEDSKRSVLDLIASMVGVKTKELEKNAGQSA